MQHKFRQPFLIYKISLNHFNFRSYDIQIFTNEPNFDNLNENFNFYNVSSNFGGIITIFDGIEDRANFFNFKSNKKTKPKSSHRDGEPMSEEYLCTFLGWLYEDGTFEPFAILSCIGSGGADFVTVGSGTGTYGGGGSSSTAPAPTPTPCEVLKKLKKDTALQSKIDLLKGKTNLHFESGFIQNLDGSTINLVNKSDHSLDMISAMTNQTIAFNHCHIEDYETEVDIDGNSNNVSPIRMFSPDDIIQFQRLIRNAYNNKIPFESIYGNMIIKDYTYTLTTSGAINNSYVPLSLSSEKLDRMYLKAMKSPNKETAILNFIQTYFGVYNINLARTDNFGNTVVLTLDSNNKIITTICNN